MIRFRHKITRLGEQCYCLGMIVVIVKRLCVEMRKYFVVSSFTTNSSICKFCGFLTMSHFSLLLLPVDKNHISQGRSSALSQNFHFRARLMLSFFLCASLSATVSFIHPLGNAKVRDFSNFFLDSSHTGNVVSSKLKSSFSMWISLRC